MAPHDFQLSTFQRRRQPLLLEFNEFNQWEQGHRHCSVTKRRPGASLFSRRITKRTICTMSWAALVREFFLDGAWTKNTCRRSG